MEVLIRCRVCVEYMQRFSRGDCAEVIIVLRFSKQGDGVWCRGPGDAQQRFRVKQR
jgi:hypothetical protein